MLYTYQDLQEASDVTKFVNDAIVKYKSSDMYKTAIEADEYDAQRNVTISQLVPYLYNISGQKVEDFTATNNKIACNLFSRLNTQRCMYSLGNGVSFVDPYDSATTRDETKERLGKRFDHNVVEAGYHALIHGVSYMFWDIDKTYVFRATEFVPLDDEYDGTMRAGIRFWQLGKNKPLNAVLYEEDGYTTYSNKDGKMHETLAKRAYKVTYQYTDFNPDEAQVVSEENYVALPVVRMYGSRLKQSTLVGMKASIDAYDIIRSGFANDVTDCAQVYWIVENFGGMTDNDLRQFLDRLKLNHIANADTQSGGKVTPYTQEIPSDARTKVLTELRNGIYEDFGALDVHVISAGATNDHIDAAYQPMDENAADFEYWVGDAIVKLLALQGIEDEPVFTRSRISNQLEQVQMVVQEAEWLDEQTVLRKLPNITPDEASAIMIARDEDEATRIGFGNPTEPVIDDEDE